MNAVHVDERTRPGSDALPPPAVYAPFAEGVYRVTPGLAPLMRNFGNGAVDTRVFQLDNQFDRFRTNLAASRADNLSKYHGFHECPPETVEAAARFMVRQMADEYPEWFTLTHDSGETRFACELTGDVFAFDDRFQLVADPTGLYYSTLDALASQVQEDVALMHVDVDTDRLVAVHVTSPSHWDPSEKLGQGFSSIHEPVAEMDGLRKKGRTLMRAMTQNVRYQRFGWGVVTDDRLNHHPVAPAAFEGDAREWNGGDFDIDDPSLFARIERQVIVGLPDVSAFLFFIRVHFLDCRTMDPNRRASLRAALLTMTEATRRYKGIADRFDDIVSWLGQEA